MHQDDGFDLGNRFSCTPFTLHHLCIRSTTTVGERQRHFCIRRVSRVWGRRWTRPVEWWDVACGCSPPRCSILRQDGRVLAIKISSKFAAAPRNLLIKICGGPDRNLCFGQGAAVGRVWARVRACEGRIYCNRVYSSISAGTSWVHAAPFTRTHPAPVEASQARSVGPTGCPESSTASGSPPAPETRGAASTAGAAAGRRPGGTS